MNFIFNFHREMVAQKLILVYEGEFTQEITKSVLSMAERNLDSFGEESAIKRKVFNVMVECLQNIVKHADEHQENDLRTSSIFMVGKEDGGYMIASGNPIPHEKKEGLSATLDRINSLDKQGLKELYKSILKNGELSDKGGAGLGFVDMARKSGNKLEYGFQPIDDEVSFFVLRTRITRVKELV